MLPMGNMVHAAVSTRPKEHYEMHTYAQATARINQSSRLTTAEGAPGIEEALQALHICEELENVHVCVGAAGSNGSCTNHINSASQVKTYARV